MRQTFNETTDRGFAARHLPRLRAELVKQGLDGLIVPHEDEHQNEYLPEANDRLGWISGFTGSAGAAVVLIDRAAIFTDGRYSLQVRDQVDESHFSYQDLVEGGVAAWLERETAAGQKIGFDPRLHSPDSLDRFEAACRRAGSSLLAVDPNPVDLAWGSERPAQPLAPIVPHALEFAGTASQDKRAALGRELGKQGIDHVVLTSPASLAWLFNIRGGDVIRSPLPLGQAILSKDGSATAFFEPEKISDELREWLGNQVVLESPERLEASLMALNGQCVSLDPGLASAWYFKTLEAAGARILRQSDPCALTRARKSDVEIAGARKAHRRDAVAVAQFLYWLATEAQTSLPDEIEVVTRLESLREASGALKDLSFDTIAGAGPNGAVVHYRPTERLNRRTEPGSLLLVDSGAQYLEGTTDITRTVAIGSPSDEMIRAFTLVLKGHLALGRVRFPVGTTGSALDAQARVALWAAGFDYDHGTGHGVGSYLGVHEGPQRIAKMPNSVALQPGMIVSNEPGYYREGAFGIRIENLQFVTPAAAIPGGDRPMMGFETLTLAPIDRRLIDSSLLSAEDREQLNAYHARVLTEIGPMVPADVAAWLADACKAI